MEKGEKRGKENKVTQIDTLKHIEHSRRRKALGLRGGSQLLLGNIVNSGFRLCVTLCPGFKDFKLATAVPSHCNPCVIVEVSIF
jgi:hypothetical protein